MATTVTAVTPPASHAFDLHLLTNGVEDLVCTLLSDLKKKQTDMSFVPACVSFQLHCNDLVETLKFCICSRYNF